MDWSNSTIWWVAAGVLVVAELNAGSFYLLMLALGCAAGALAAHAGLPSSWQVVVAAAIGSGATALWHFKRARAPRSAPAESNRDVNLDVGERIRIPVWDETLSSRVEYRGSLWTVQFRGSGKPQPGEHVIVAVQGNRLIVASAAP
jgi:membrane protein implicated in regulation of membrane protease activity